MISYNAQLHHLANGRHGHHGRSAWSRAVHLVKQLRCRGAQAVAFSFECPYDGHQTSQGSPGTTSTGINFKVLQLHMVERSWIVFFGASCCISICMPRIAAWVPQTWYGTGGLQPTTVTFNSAMTSSAWEAMDDG